MNLALEIQMDWKKIQKFYLQFFFSLLLDLEKSNVPRCELTSYLETS
jgi:hypothetical protein